MRWRKAPSFHRLSRVARLSETQSVAGVIWSVSMASRFFPGRLGSQKMSARPRTGFMVGFYRRVRGGASEARSHGCVLSARLQLVERSFKCALYGVHRLALKRVADRGLGARGLQLGEGARGRGTHPEPGVAQELDQTRLDPPVRDAQLAERLGRRLARLVLVFGTRVVEQHRHRARVLERGQAVEDELAQDIAVALAAQLRA